jgi:hypothetical protein
MTMSSCALTVISLLALLPLRVVAQEPPRPPASPTPAATASPTPTPTPEASPTPRDPMSTPTFNGLRMRSIGPAFTSGRVSGFAVDPTTGALLRRVASGGVWKTVNAGITWTPVFDQRRLLFDRRDRARSKESFDCLGRHRREQQPAQRLVRQRRLSSDDGGKTWRNVGLKTSEHIGRIAIDPKDSNIVYVAAQGPLVGTGRRSRSFQNH